MPPPDPPPTLEGPLGAKLYSPFFPQRLGAVATECRVSRARKKAKVTRKIELLSLGFMPERSPTALT